MQDHIVKYTTPVHHDRSTRLVENTTFVKENKATTHSTSLRFKLSTTYLSQFWSSQKDHNYWKDIFSFPRPILELPPISCRDSKNFYVEQKRQRKESHLWQFFWCIWENLCSLCEHNISGEFVCFNNSVDESCITSFRAVHYIPFKKSKQYTNKYIKFLFLQSLLKNLFLSRSHLE